MSWSKTHECYAMLDALIASGDPSSLNGAEVQRLFGGLEGLYMALHQRWRTCLEAKLDNAIEMGEAPENAWDELASEQPALHALLDSASATWAAVRDAELEDVQIVDSLRHPEHAGPDHNGARSAPTRSAVPVR